MEENNRVHWLVWVLVGVLVWAIFLHKDTYEGKTAEEWFNAYDEAESRYEEFRNCIEDYDSLNIEDQIDYGGALNYCE